MRIKYLYIILCMLCVCASCRHTLHIDVDRTHFPVKGIDISSHNGKIDFEQVKADSVSFVIIKATEGTDFCDAMFSENYTRAKDANLKIGAYHFFRFDTPGHIQAYHFLTALEGKTFDLPLAVDVEDWRNAQNVPVDEVVAQLQNLIDVIRASGNKAMIYTNKSGYEKYIRGNFDNVPLWICTFAGVPTLDDAPWLFWQHSHKGKVKGVSGDVDLNTFNGTSPDFSSYIVKLDSLPF